jgi:hypothetical protein
VAGTTTLTLPAATDTLVGKATTDTLTNKTLTGAAMNGTLGATTPSTGAFTTLTTTGNVGVGTTTLDERLNVVNTGTFAAVRVSNGTNNSYFGYAQSDGNYNTGAKAGDAFIRGHAGVSIESSGGTSGIRVNTSGNLQTFGTVSVGNATPSTSGAGITFPATQSASTNANTLDDYEEGNFTPTITFGGASVGVTYNATFTGATYTKIGNRVCVTGYILMTNKGSSTGDVGISNLPFVSEAGTTKYLGASVGGVGFTFTNQFWARISPNTTTIDLFETTILGVTSPLTNSDFSNDSQVYFSATYSF